MLKKIGAAAAVMLAATMLAGCGAAKGDKSTLTIWVYPIGYFAEPELDEDDIPLTTDGAAELAKAFEKSHKGSHVEIVYKDFDGSDGLSNAQADGTAPDLVLDSAERLLNNVTSGAILADTSNLGWVDDMTNDVNATNENIIAGCRSSDGVMRVYPVSVNVDCMAVNPDILKKIGMADALGDDHTWTKDEFRSILETVQNNGYYMPAILPGGGIAGDQGRRMLLQNWIGSSYTDPEHTKFLLGGEETISAMRELVGLNDNGLLCYVKAANAVDEMTSFIGGATALTCEWSATAQNVYAKRAGFAPVPMAFPSDGTPQLYGTVYGFGVPQNGENHDTISALAVEFIKFACEDPEQGPETVRLTGALPVRSHMGNVYADDDDMNDGMAQLSALLPYLGDLYGVTPHWNEQRSALYNMFRTAYTGEVENAPEPTPEPTPAPVEEGAEGEVPAEGEPTPPPVADDKVTTAVNNFVAELAAAQ